MPLHNTLIIENAFYMAKTGVLIFDGSGMPEVGIDDGDSQRTRRGTPQPVLARGAARDQTSFGERRHRVREGDGNPVRSATTGSNYTDLPGGDRSHAPRPRPTSTAIFKVDRAKIRALRASRERAPEDNLNFFNNAAANSGTRAASGKQIIVVSCYYYTINDSLAVRFTYNNMQGWILRVNYCDSHQKKTTKRKRLRAASNNPKLSVPSRPRIYTTENEALAMAAEFRLHVEDMVRGGRPFSTRHLLTSPETITILQANKERAARTVGRSLLR